MKDRGERRRNDVQGVLPSLLAALLVASALMLCAFPANALSGIRVMADSVLMPADSLEFPLPPDGFSMEICGRMKPERRSGALQWTLRLLGTDRRQEGAVTILVDETLPGDFDAGSRVVARLCGPENDTRTETVVCGNPWQTDGFFTVSVTVTDGFAEYWAGNESYLSVGTFTVGRITAGVVRTSAPLEIKAVNIRGADHEPWRQYRRPEVRDTPDMARQDSPCGIYRFLDYETETRRALRGGDYRLGVVPSEGGGFDLVYLAGAEYNSGGWEPGMVKGHLEPTVFVNHYDLAWTDASFRTDIAGAWGEFSQDGALMILYFPNEKAVLRFSRESTAH